MISLTNSLRKYHSGVHKWFQKYVKNHNAADNTLDYDDFSKAVRDLNCNTVTESAVGEIFNALDRNMTRKVAIAEIENLFKSHARMSNPHIKVDDVLSNVISAFNGDV